MSEQKADKIQLEAMKLVSFELSSLLIFLHYIGYARLLLMFSFVGISDSQAVKVPTGFTTATEMHLKRSQIIQVFC